MMSVYHHHHTGSNGIAFSGGGARAYLTATGVLAALEELQLIEKTRYLTGMSGGAWAVTAFTFAQTGVTNGMLLGRITPPENITSDNLLIMDENYGMRYFATKQPPNNFVNNTIPTFGEWQAAIQYVYLDGPSIPKGVPFSFDSQTVSDIKKRNPSLKDENFVVMRRGKLPLPILGATVIGPASMMPFTSWNRNYTLMEFTPLAVGVLKTQEVVYKTVDGKETTVDTVGGLIEPWAFSAYGPPTHALRSSRGGTTNLKLSATKVGPILDLNFVISSSSFYGGCGIAGLDTLSVNERIRLSDNVTYWSPAATGISNKFVLGDGGSLQNDNIISLIQRKVKRVICICSSSVVLQPREKWDPEVDALHSNHIDFFIPALFGLIPENMTTKDTLLYDVTKSRIFDSKEWIPLAKELQAALSRGKGVVVTRNLVTVRNEYYGIEEGFEVKVLFYYLARATEWETALSPAMKELVQPEENGMDLSQERGSGPFINFPNYQTSFAGTSRERANLLANFAGWVVLENQSLFKEMLQD